MAVLHNEGCALDTVHMSCIILMTDTETTADHQYNDDDDQSHHCNGHSYRQLKPKYQRKFCMTYGIHCILHTLESNTYPATVFNHCLLLYRQSDKYKPLTDRHHSFGVWLL